MTMLNHAHSHSHNHAHGFTLIELLVVLIIISIMTSVAVLTFGHFGRGRQEKIIAQEFAQTISAAEQQAILTPEILRLCITQHGYRFYALYHAINGQNKKWMRLHDDALSQLNAFYSIFNVTIKSHSNNIVFYPSGAVTPFQLQLKSKTQVFLINAKENGVVDVRCERDKRDPTT